MSIFNPFLSEERFPNKYRNGNYLVLLDDCTGTKVYTSLVAGENFKPDFPDSLDIKLTNKCFHKCPYCHENSTPLGNEGNLEELKKVLESLPKYPIELAFGGGDIFTIPGDKLSKFFKWCRERNYKVGVTINIKDAKRFITDRNHFLNDKNVVNNIGISIDHSFYINNSDPSTGLFKDNSDFETFLSDFRRIGIGINYVFHLVLGTFSSKWLDYFLRYLYMNYYGGTLRVIFLGYKISGRGNNWKSNYIQEEIDQIRKLLIKEYIRNLQFGYKPASNPYQRRIAISFDNLALEQLRMREAFTTSEWERIYMGNEFSHSMYIDAVTKIFAPTSSTPLESDERVSWDDYNSNIVDYFKTNRNEH